MAICVGDAVPKSLFTVWLDDADDVISRAGRAGVLILNRTEHHRLRPRCRSEIHATIHTGANARRRRNRRMNVVPVQWRNDRHWVWRRCYVVRPSIVRTPLHALLLSRWRFGRLRRWRLFVWRRSLRTRLWSFGRCWRGRRRGARLVRVDKQLPVLAELAANDQINAGLILERCCDLFLPSRIEICAVIPLLFSITRLRLGVFVITVPPNGELIEICVVFVLTFPLTTKTIAVNYRQRMPERGGPIGHFARRHLVLDDVDVDPLVLTLERHVEGDCLEAILILEGVEMLARIPICRERREVVVEVLPGYLVFGVLVQRIESVQSAVNRFARISPA